MRREKIIKWVVFIKEKSFFSFENHFHLMIFFRRIVFYRDSGPKTSPLSGIPLHDFLVAYCVFTRILSRVPAIKWNTTSHVSPARACVCVSVCTFVYVCVCVCMGFSVCVCRRRAVQHLLICWRKQSQNSPPPWKKLSPFLSYLAPAQSLSGIGLSMFHRGGPISCRRMFPAWGGTLIGRSHLIVSHGCGDKLFSRERDFW